MVQTRAASALPGAIPLADGALHKAPSRAQPKRKGATTARAVSPAIPATPAISVPEALPKVIKTREALNDNIASDPQHDTENMDSLVVALVSSQEDSASIAPQTTRQSKTIFPVEILTEICSYFSPSLSDSSAISALKKRTRKSLSLASKEFHDVVYKYRFRIVDVTPSGRYCPCTMLDKLMAQPERTILIRELAIDDTRRVTPCPALMQRIQDYLQPLAVPATLKHELMHNSLYPGCVVRHAILLSVSGRLELLSLDSHFFCLRQGLLNIFQEAARPGSTFLPRLREVNVKMMKMLPTGQLQAILRLPGLETFECHGYVSTIQRTRQTTGPRQIVAVHYEQRHDGSGSWLASLLQACPSLEDLSMMTHNHSQGHNSVEYTTMGDTLRTYGQQLLHLKFVNRCKTEVDSTCSDKMDALGTLEPLARLQTLSVSCSSKVEYSRPICWSCVQVY